MTKAEIDKRYYQTDKGRITRNRAKARYENSLPGWANKQVRRIRYRCTNEHARMFYRYGKRQIRLMFTGRELAEWIERNGFEYLGMHLHRIENDGDYSLDNVMLLTPEHHRDVHWGGCPV